jgi:anti-sigma regulatory factor (Ser/Thr protein kinase)
MTHGEVKMKDEIIESYREKIMEKYGYVDISYYSSGQDDAEVNRLKHTPIDNIFVEVDFREYKEDGRTTYFPGMLSDPGDKIILSGPGGGKTTFLKMMMRTKINEELIPIYWEWENLYDQINGTSDPDTILCDYFNKCLENSFDTKEIDSFIRRNQFVFLIDRFDKIAFLEGFPALDRIFKGLKRDSRNISKGNIFVIASGPADYSDEYHERFKKNGFRLYQINPLTDNSIYNYVKKYVSLVFSSDDKLKIPEIISKLVEYIEKWPRVKMLACNPIFLNQIISIRKKEDVLPSTELNLYRKCVQMMLQDWKNPEENLIKFEKLGLTDDEIIDELLNETAYEYFNKFVNAKINEFGTLSREELKNTLTQIYRNLSRLKQIKNDTEVKESVDDLFTYFKNDLGVIVEKSKGQFGFSHFLLLEYLAAHYLRKMYSGKEQCENYIMEILKNPRFKNVEGTILFQIEMADLNAPKFIDKLTKKLLELYKSQKNVNILFLLAKLLKDSEYLSLEYTGEILSQLAVFKSEHPENKEIPNIIAEIYICSKAFKHEFDLLINKLNVERESWRTFTDKATEWTGGKAKSIKNFIEKELPSPSPTIHKTIGKLKEQLNLLENILDRYNELKCKDEIIIKRGKLNDIMNDIVDHLLRQLSGSAEISYSSCKDGENKVSTDKDRIFQVIEELAKNSIQHSKSIKKKVKIKLSVESNGSKFIIHYRDNGKGIPQSEKNKVFEPFYSGNKEKCIGIGLACVKQNVETMGGKIDEIGNENKGVHFRIFLINKDRDKII